MLGGEATQVVLSVRDLNSDNVPQKSWAGEHLAYTHGYGAIVAPANAKDPSGEPVFVGKDVPYESEADSLALNEKGRGIYFGEELSSYVDHGHEAARGQLPGRGRHASTRPTRARTASSSTTRSSGLRSRCASGRRTC